MKISYNWLKEYLDINLSADEVSKRLTACGLEVENVDVRETVPGGFREVYIGQVLTCQPHPNADRLTITTVDNGGSEPLHIVCGAPNVAPGQKVVVACIGARVKMGDQEVEMKKTKIRGELSEGMICAEDELGLGSSHEGILVLPSEAVVGTPAREYFGVTTDHIFEIGLTPNRSDAASHLGVARDLAAVLRNEAYLANEALPVLRRPDTGMFIQDDHSLPIGVVVKDEQACIRYSGITMTGLRVGESPRWLIERLQAVGLRPINNLVDISNYVMMETGQPLHFFDADKVTGHKVIVGALPGGTPFTTLDQVDRVLSSEDLMICDASGGMCIAGVFGGMRSGVTETTTSIFIESATFNAVSVRKTSRRHGLKTDASFRFERGSDPEMTVYALLRAVQLIRELAGGKVSSPLIDIYPKQVKPVNLDLRLASVDTLIGKVIPREHLAFILESLDINILGITAESFRIEVPSYRVDVTREADVIEEILRIYGYNNVEEPERLRSALAFGQHPDRDRLRNQVSDVLVGQGFHEIMCNSLSYSGLYGRQEEWPLSNCVPILNPVSQDLDVMRQTLVYGGLETVRHNRNRKVSDLKLFEFGNIYRTDGSLPLPSSTLGPYAEQTSLLLMLSGNRTPESWNSPAHPVDFFDLKSALEVILEKLGIEDYQYVPKPRGFFAEGLDLMVKGKDAAWFGLLNKGILQPFDIEAPVFAAELHWDILVEAVGSSKMSFVPVARFPEVRRDLALVVDQSVTFHAMKECALGAERKLLRDVKLFDVYEGKGIEEGKKSYALSFILLDEEKTLTDKVIEKSMERIRQALEQDFGARLR